MNLGGQLMGQLLLACHRIRHLPTVDPWQILGAPPSPGILFSPGARTLFWAFPLATLRLLPLSSRTPTSLCPELSGCLWFPEKETPCPTPWTRTVFPVGQNRGRWFLSLRSELGTLTCCTQTLEAHWHSCPYALGCPSLCPNTLLFSRFSF